MSKNTPSDFRHRLPKDMREVIVNNQKVSKLWAGLTPLARNEWICWVTIVKKAETRKDHLKRFQEDLLKGKRRPCCWPGCPHRRPKAKNGLMKRARKSEIKFSTSRSKR